MKANMQYTRQYNKKCPPKQLVKRPAYYSDIPIFNYWSNNNLLLYFSYIILLKNTLLALLAGGDYI